MWTTRDFFLRGKSVAQKVILNFVTSFRRLQYLKNDTRRRDIHLLAHTQTDTLVSGGLIPLLYVFFFQQVTSFQEISSCSMTTLKLSISLDKALEIDNFDILSGKTHLTNILFSCRRLFHIANGEENQYFILNFNT